MSVVTDFISKPPGAAATAVASPISVRNRLNGLTVRRQDREAERQRKASRLDELNEFLAIVPAIDDAMEKLSAELFSKLAELLQGHLTSILQDVLQQPIKVVATQDHKRGAATLRLHIERDGQEEDIMRGSGGSVANVLSVGLRLLALAQLDPNVHRRFLVLDEQDCWLAPELVPRLVKIVSEAGDAMGFQVVMISHHAASAFEQFGKRIYRLVPGAGGVSVETVGGPAKHADAGSDGL